MRTRFLISALFLIGMTMSVAASSYKPPTEAKRDAGVTKVEKFTDLFTEVTPVLLTENDLAVIESAAILESNVVYSAPFANHKNPAIKEKLYLNHCAIRQCTGETVAAV